MSTASDARVRTRLYERVGERTTPLLELTLVDEAGDPIPTLTSLTLVITSSLGTLRERASVIDAFSAGDFGSPRAVEIGDTLNVQVTIEVAAA